MPPIPFNRKNFLFWVMSFVLEKCLLSLVMTSLRPVNRLLGFGMRGMTPSDIILSPLLLLWMCICPVFMLSVWFKEHLHDNHSTHSVCGIECVVVSNKVVSTRKNARSAHIEILKSERFRMREGRKGERLEARTRPPSTCLDFFRSRSFLGGLLSSVGSLTFLVMMPSSISTSGKFIFEFSLITAMANDYTTGSILPLSKIPACSRSRTPTPSHFPPFN